MFYLLFYADKESSPQKIQLESTAYLIGRHSSCNLVVEKEHISRFHFTLILITDASNTIHCLIKDGHWRGGKSSNGTWVNGERINSLILRNNDLITFSSTLDYPRADFTRETVEEKAGESTLNGNKDI